MNCRQTCCFAAWLTLGWAVALAQPSSTQPVDWAQAQYAPGTAAGRSGKPTEATPPWKTVSFSKPHRIELAEDYLLLSTGDDQQPEAGQIAYRLTLPEPAANFTLEIDARVAQSRGTFAGSVLLGNEKEFIELRLGQKQALLGGSTGWTSGDYAKPTRYRLVFRQDGGGGLTLLYLNDALKPAQSSGNFKGPVQFIQFGDPTQRGDLSGTVEWRSLSWAAAAIAPAGASTVPAIHGPAVELRGDGASFDQLQDGPQAMRFVLSAPAGAAIVVRPRAMAIEKDRAYNVNTSVFPPFTVRAQTEGELAVEFAAADNLAVLIEPQVGDNLVPDSSFESGEGWRGVLDASVTTRLDWGHESAATDAASGATAPPAGEARLITQRARTGHSSFLLAKRGGTGSAEARLVSPLRIEAGHEYLLEGYYQLEQANFGDALQLMAALTGPSLKPLSFRDFNLNPLVYTGAGQWRRAFVRFKVPAGYTEAQIRLSARGATIRAYWDDVSLRVAPTGVTQPLPRWDESRARPPLSPEQVTEIWRKRAPRRVELLGDSRPRLRVDGSILPLFGFNDGPSWFPRSAPHEALPKAGVRLTWLPLALANGGPSGGWGVGCWRGPGVYDFAELEKRLSYVLGHDPDAHVLIYLLADPDPGFGDRHPDSRWLNAEGKPGIGDKSDWRAATTRPQKEAWNISLSSQEFREETATGLEALGRHLAASDLGKAVVGIHLVAGSDGQWFAPSSPDHLDRSPAAVRSFQAWLRQRYGNDPAALRAAWGQPDLDFDRAPLPDEKERYAEAWFLDPAMAAHRRVIDANRFSSEGVAHTINHLAAAFKRGLGRRGIVTTYYHDILHNHMMNHWALRMLLENDALDGVVSVTSYGPWRALGRTGCFNSLISSLSLHNKLYLTEMDYRSDWSWLPGDALQRRADWGVPAGAEGLLHQFRRDLGMSLARGGGGWCYGLGGADAFRRPEYQQVLAEVSRAAEQVAQAPRPNDAGQIGVFADEQIEDYTTRRDFFGANTAMVAHNTARAALARSGLSWDPYLLSDLDHPARPDYKLNLFLSAPTITPRQVAWVEQHLQKDRRVLVFVHAAGLSDGEGFESNIRRLCGITVKRSPARVLYRLATAGDDALAEGIENAFTESAGPLFYVDDPTATPLATLDGTGRVVAAVKRHAGWTGVYLAAPGNFSPRWLRKLAAEAGLTPIGPEGDATYAGNGVLVLHAISPGSKTLRWGRPEDLVDLSSGQIVARDVREYTFNAAALETRWFRRVNRENRP